MTASPSARVRLVRERLVGTPGRAALASAAATFALLALLAGGPGISRDEAEVLGRRDPALRGALASISAAHPAPPLAGHAAAITRTVLAPLGLSHLRAARLGTALFGALLSGALVLLAWEISGAAAALLAPALFWAVPRHLHAGLVATPDLALAALSAAIVLAWRRAARDPDPRRRLRAAVQAGLLLGVALAARADAWILVPALAAHAAISRALGETPPPDGVGRRLRAIPLALLAMATLGPLALVVLWPSVLAGGARAFAPASAPSVLHPVAVTVLSVPATILLACVAGMALALLRILRAARRRAPGEPVADEALLLLCAAAPLLAAAAGIPQAAPGVRPWLHAMPFLAVLGARALLSAARTAWPARSAAVAGSLALLVLWPAVRATVHFHPSGSSAWNELAGGVPGAATMGLPRQDGGEAVAALLEALNARAREGSRVFWPSTPESAVRALARDGRLRGDLRVATAPEEADIAVVTLDGGSRETEYRTWSAFRTARPVAGAYLDEVPLAFVYARPGAWR